MTTLQQGVRALDGRMSAAESRVGGLESRMASAEGRLGTAEARLSQADFSGRLVMTDGRYGWDGGYGTVWFTDPHRDLIAIALTQNSDFLFRGGREEFTQLALATAG